MKRKSNTLFLILVLIFLSIMSFFFISFVKANGNTSDAYTSDVQVDDLFVYNVSEFGGSSMWFNTTPWPGDSYEGDFETNQGGQIKLQLKGYFNFSGNIINDKIPWFDIEVLKMDAGVLNSNFSLSNRSNNEISSNLILGYNKSQFGFLIPNNNLSYIKSIAEDQANGYFLGDVSIEESYNFLFIGYEQASGGQTTNLIYDKKTGLLVQAETSFLDYRLEMKLLNYTFDYSKLFQYNVSDFGDNPAWWFVFSDKGFYQTSDDGLINVEFNGLYSRDSGDWGDSFPDMIPWCNISIYNRTLAGLTLNFTQYNVSNKEVAMALNLGFNNFLSGFLIPSIQNITQIKKIALEEATGFTNGTVLLSETKLTLGIQFDEIGGTQKMEMIYEKQTGLLLWANVKYSEFLLNLTLYGYSPWQFKTDTTPLDPINLQWIPYILIASVVFLGIGGSFLISKFKTKFKKYNKFVIIGLIAAGSFSSLILFATSFSTPPVNDKLENVSNITLVVDYGNGTVYTESNFDLTNYETTAFDALDEWTEIIYTDYGTQGLLVEEINGIKANWKYSINGEYQGIASNKYNLKDGDIVEWYVN
ncbi:MAG: hypothetical protein GF317_14235 [Candidatus Lokiarchaeota archaeon]|nr:hypothetical protein [Candidatus Lokiarchaeota archaeon]MBD3200775.1 hypothetical protein [Candidatus Lokiarchaeota archaeon]